MKRLPLSDELPYEFIPPRVTGFWFWAGGFYNRYLLSREQKIAEIDVAGVDRLLALVERGDSVLITPNHADHADAFVLYELSRRIRNPFTYMAAYQIFTGMARWVLPRVGVFSVDREGADLSAFKAAVNLLTEGKHPLVIFPEGEIYRVAERVTPLREGAFAIAAAAARKLEVKSRKLWIVPAGLCYRFLEGHDPLPALQTLMDRLEIRFTWRIKSDRPLVERILHFADGILCLKEVEYMGSPSSGTFKERAANLIERILAAIEDRRLKGKRSLTVPERVKDLRKVCLEAIEKEQASGNSPAAIDARHDIEDLFLVIQIFSYPADYVRLNPTVERIAETLMKCEEDVLGVDQAPPRARRRALARFGEPVDLSERLAEPGMARSRQLVTTLTGEIEGRIQAILDAMPLGRDLAVPPKGETPGGIPSGGSQSNVLADRTG
jgi:1-acyl-sn-glycerol-3-phosphate acyltransferase